jgi:predicted transposase YbfD/YdcC
VRSHWGVENNLHWSLHIAFREDESRLRERTAAQNVAVLRHIALALLKNDTGSQAWNQEQSLKAG